MKNLRLLALFITGALAACASTPADDPPPCEERIKLKPYPYPVYVGNIIPEIPPAPTPTYPPTPIAGADDENLKAYSLRVGEVVKERAALCKGENEALRVQIRANNEYARRHPAPTPTPEPNPE